MDDAPTTPERVQRRNQHCAGAADSQSPGPLLGRGFCALRIRLRPEWPLPSSSPPRARPSAARTRARSWTMRPGRPRRADRRARRSRRCRSSTRGSIDDVYVGCASPPASTGQHGRAVAVRARARHRARRRPSTGSAPRACRRSGWRSTRSGPARATRSSAAASSVCRATATRRAAAGSTGADNPRVRGGEGAHGARGGEHAAWADPREDGCLPDVYIAMGQTAENVAAARAESAAQEQDEFGVPSARTAPSGRSRTASASARSRR